MVVMEQVQLEQFWLLLVIQIPEMEVEVELV